jgi:hypothetical protein
MRVALVDSVYAREGEMQHYVLVAIVARRDLVDLGEVF